MFLWIGEVRRLLWKYILGNILNDGLFQKASLHKILTVGYWNFERKNYAKQKWDSVCSCKNWVVLVEPIVTPIQNQSTGPVPFRCTWQIFARKNININAQNRIQPLVFKSVRERQKLSALSCCNDFSFSQVFNY